MMLIEHRIDRALNDGKSDVIFQWLLNIIAPKSSNKKHVCKRYKTLSKAFEKIAETIDKEPQKLREKCSKQKDLSGLSYAQLQMFTLYQMDPKSMSYNVVEAKKIRSQVDLSVLHFACKAVMKKHPVLRTRFSINSEGEPLQLVVPIEDATVPLQIHIGTSDERNDWIMATINQPFNIMDELPIRFVLIQSEQSQEEAALVVVMHHIVTDAQSSSIFWRDLERFYRGFPFEDQVNSTLTYGAFAVWQRSRLEDGVLSTSLQYWIDKFSSGTIPVLELPMVEGYNHENSSHAQRLIFHLDSQLSHQFQSLCGANNASLFMGLLAVFHTLLSRLSCQEDIVIGIPTSGRSISEGLTPEDQNALDQMMGYFVNTLALRIDSTKSKTFLDFLLQVKEEVLEAFQHGEIPLQMILEHLSVPRSIEKTRNPFYNVMFAWADDSSSQETSLFESFDLSCDNAQSEAKFDLMLTMSWDKGRRCLQGCLEYPSGLFTAEMVKKYMGALQEIIKTSTQDPFQPINHLIIVPPGERQLLLNEWITTDGTRQAQVHQDPYVKIQMPEQLSPSSSRTASDSSYSSDSDNDSGSSPETEKTETKSDEVHHHNTKSQQSLGCRALETIDAWFRFQANNTPQSIAIHYEGTHKTYDELLQVSENITDAIQSIVNKVGSTIRVGLFLDRGFENTACMLGVLQAGSAFVPFDVSFPVDRLVYMLEDSQVQVILTSNNLYSRIEQILKATNPQFHSKVKVFAIEEYLEPQRNSSDILMGKRRSLPKSDPNSLAYILYTSGSTGKPKGVMVSHRNLLTTLLWTIKEYQVVSSDIFLQTTTSTLDGSLSQLFSPLLTGASVVITRPNGLHDMEYMRSLFLFYRISFCVFVPSYFSIFLDFCSEQMDCFIPVKYIVLAGEVFPFELGKKFYSNVQNWIDTKPHMQDSKIHIGTCLVNEYGPTEAAITSSFYRFSLEQALCSSSPASGSIPIGRPIDDRYLIVLDPKRRLVPINTVGELYIGGDGVALGYWNRPDLTTKSFLNHEELFDGSNRLVDVFPRGFRWYKTGDLVKWLPSGDLVFMGRSDHQVKLHGMRIELQEIRHLILKYNSNIIQDAEVQVIQKERLVAFVILQKSANDQMTDHLKCLRTYLQNMLPQHMVPHEFRVLKEWPRTPNGKLNVKVLGNTEVQCQFPLSKHDTATTIAVLSGGQEDVEIRQRPTGQIIENILKLAWMKTLALENSVQESLMNATFFELGGNSLSAIRVITFVKSYGLLLKLEYFFRAKNIRHMAEMILHSVCSSKETLFNGAATQIVPLNSCGHEQQENQRPPLFLTHCADGTVWKFLPLARLLPFPVYGIQSNFSSTLTTVEALAACYWKQIKSIQPRGPYYLGGFSFGCRVAFEIAQLALEEGHLVNPLLLLDALPVKDYTMIDQAHEEIFLREYLDQALRCHMNEKITEDSSYFEKLSRQFLAHCDMDAKYKPFDDGGNSTRILKPLCIQLFKTTRWHIRSEEEETFKSHGITMECIELSSQHITHMTLFDKENVNLLAQTILDANQIV